MEIIALVLRLIIAVVFFVAGTAKIADLKGTRKAIKDFGGPDWAAGPLSVLLPLAELGAAVLLLPTSTVLWGSLAAITLLLLFIAAISLNLVRGRRPSCNCFGQLHSEPVGWPTLIRNVTLAGGAIVVFWGANSGNPLNILSLLSGLSTTEIIFRTLLIAVVATQGWLTLHLLSQNGDFCYAWILWKHS